MGPVSARLLVSASVGAAALTSATSIASQWSFYSLCIIFGLIITIIGLVVVSALLVLSLFRILVAYSTIVVVTSPWSTSRASHSHFTSACTYSQVTLSNSGAWTLVSIIFVGSLFVVVTWMGWSLVVGIKVVWLRSVPASWVWLVLASRWGVSLLIVVVVASSSVVVFVAGGCRSPLIVLSATTVLAVSSIIVIVLHFVSSLVLLWVAALIPTVWLLHGTASAPHWLPTSLLILHRVIWILVVHVHGRAMGMLHSAIIIVIVLTIVHIGLVSAAGSSCTPWSVRRSVISIILVVILSISVVEWTLNEMGVISATSGWCITPLSWSTPLSVLAASFSNLWFMGTALFALRASVSALLSLRFLISCWRLCLARWSHVSWRCSPSGATTCSDLLSTPWWSSDTLIYIEVGVFSNARFDIRVIIVTLLRSLAARASTSSSFVWMTLSFVFLGILLFRLLFILVFVRGTNIRRLVVYLLIVGLGLIVFLLNVWFIVRWFLWGLRRLIAWIIGV